MTEEKAASEPTLVEKWIKDQQEWQKTATAYFDSLVRNDEFLVHLGNAMRGSLLAGKPYPGSQPPSGEPAAEAAAESDDRIDEILHALHRIQGELTDLRMTVDDIAVKLAAATRPSQPGEGGTGRGGA